MDDRYLLELGTLIRPALVFDHERRLDRDATTLTAPLRLMRRNPEAWRRLWEANRTALAAGVRMP